MSPRAIRVDLDESLLAEAQRVLGTTTIAETIEGALRELLRAEARRSEVDALSTLRGLDLGDDELMAKAWQA